MFTGVVATLGSIGGGVVGREPLEDVVRLRVIGKREGEAQRVVGVTEERTADRLSAQNVAAEMAPHPSERRVSEDEAQFEGGVWLNASNGNEVDTGEGNGTLDERVLIGWEESHRLNFSRLASGRSYALGWPAGHHERTANTELGHQGGEREDRS